MALGNLQELIPAIFTGPNGERLTPEQIAQRQEIAQSLMARATDTRPDAGGIASVLTKGLLGFQSGRNNSSADNAIKANATASEANMSAMLGSLGLGGGNAYPAAVTAGASPTSAAATNTAPMAIPSAPEIRKGLIQRGLPEHVSDAFIANFQDESGLNPGINEINPTVAGSRGGFGLYQLTGPRRREYEAFAAQSGVNPADTNAQLDFLMKELGGSESAAAKKILSSPDTATAAQAIVNDFLRPAPEHRQSRSARYANLASPTAPVEAAIINPALGNQAPLESQITPAAFDARFAGSPEQVAPMQQPVQSPQVPQQAAIGNTGVPSGAGQQGEIRLGSDGQAYQYAETTGMRGATGSSGWIPTSQSPSQNLLRQNDMALGGALSESGGSPVAQALAGYFPDAPSANRSPIMPQQQQAQMPMQQAAQQPQMSGINPAVIQALSSPYATAQEKQIAGLLLNKQMEQQSTAQAQQQEMQRRQQVAQAAGINPMYANDPELWKEAAKNAFKTPDRTSDIQNYEYARNNGYGGSFADYQQEVKRAGATNVDARQMGSIPAGYKVDYNELGQPISMSPIAGSPDALKMEQAKIAKDASQENKGNTANIVSQDIDRALEVIDSSNLPTTGAAGSWLSSIGGTAANDLKNLITTVQANAGFDKLQSMRDASPTGGALGAISERELTYLQSTIGSLEQSQSKDQLRYNLNRVKQAYSDIINGPKKTEARNDPLSTNKRIQDMSDDELRALANGN